MAKYSFEQKPGESIESYYRRIAKVADQRLVRLERLANEKGYGNADKWAYRRAMSDIETWSGEGAKRFNTKPPESVQAMRAKINDIKTFLGAPSSTKSGIKDIYQKRADELNRNHPGYNFTVDDLEKLFGDGNNIPEKYDGSDTTVNAIGWIKENANDRKTLNALKAQAKNKKTPIFSGDPMLDDRIQTLLRDKDIVKTMYSVIKASK